MNLRKLRTVVATVVLVAVTLLFLDFTGTAHLVLGWLAKIQFLPAVLALNVGVVVALVVLTLLFGRLYCSVICPLGILQDLFGRLGRKAKKNRYGYSKPRNVLRYGFLVLFVALMVAGVGQVAALIAPYSAFGRIASTLLAPVWQYANNGLAWVAERAGSYAFYSVDVWWKGGALLAVALTTLIVVGVLAWRNGRSWCNTVCPVGTVLGFLSRYSWLRPVINTEKCNSCGLCARKCKSECINPVTHSIDPTRCVVCFDCIDNCSQGAISFSPIKIAKQNLQAKSASKANTPKPNPKSDAVDMSRGRFLASLAAAATIPAADMVLAQGRHGGNGKGGGRGMEQSHSGPRPVAPPGARSLSQLHAKCTACHLCVSKCPTHVLQPAITEYGLQGVMQPVMRYDKGYCLYDCTLCGEVCPTGAIDLLDREEKKMTFIGHAVFNRERCIVAVDGVECGNCAEHCPAEAIKMVKSPIDRRTYPEIEKALCIGCGRCEYLCPATPIKAITVKGYKTHK